jgi:pimeloyl-ACP methyl ester carboxylesterase
LTDDFLEAEIASQARNHVSWSTLIERTITARGVKPEFVLGERWRLLSVQTTFLIGDRDAIGSVRSVEKIVATNEAFRMVVVRDAGHVPWLDSPEVVAAAITRS